MVVASVDEWSNGAVLTCRLDEVLSWARRQPDERWTLAGGCCGGGGSPAGAARLRLPPTRPPARSNLLLVAGAVTLKGGPELVALWQQMAWPRWAVAVGNCASSGAPFDGYGVFPGLASLVPVSCLVPGCPPAPTQLLAALEMLAGP